MGLVINVEAEEGVDAESQRSGRWSEINRQGSGVGLIRGGDMD